MRHIETMSINGYLNSLPHPTQHELQHHQHPIFDDQVSLG